MKFEESRKRAQKIIELAKTGKYTQKKLADRFGLSKTRVNGILKDAKVSTVKIRIKKTEEEKERECIERYGIGRREFEGIDRRLRNKLYRLLTNTRMRARRKNWMENTLKFCDILNEYRKTEGRCPVFQTPFEDRGERVASIDRIDNEKGYTPENIQMISWRANRIKHNASIEEIEQLLNFLKK